MFDLCEKNVVYVGGFGGLGYQACRILLSKKVANLVVCSRMQNNEFMHQLQAEYPNVKVNFVQMNIIDNASIEKGIKKIVDHVKYIDVLINGAGVIAEKDVEKTIGVNLTGLINTTLMAMPYMDKQQFGRGGIVCNISSVYGLEPAPAMAVYGAAKHGVVGFTRSLADKHYYQKTGVCFICVCPGLTSTELMVNLKENVTFDYSTEMANLVASAKQQKPEECANNMIMAIEIMKNGAMYICNMGEMKEIVPTSYWHM